MSTPTILVVEDNPRTRKLLRVTLESDGCEVLEAGDGAEARAMLSRHPDVVVVDLLLPDVSGLDLRAEIAEAPGCALTPVIAISGYAQGLDAANAAGFADRLIKPVEPSTLLGTIRRWLPQVDDEPVRGAPRILIADDTEIQRKLTALRLRGCGYEVLEAADGLTAFERIRSERPDVVLTDVLMPGLDGFELCRRVSADPALADIPVVLASSVFVEPADRDLATAAGATGYVTREPDLKAVIAAVARALGAGDGGPAAAGEAPEFDRLRAGRLSRALVDQAQGQERLERELEERDAQLAVLAGIAETLARTSDPATVIEEILARCVEATGVAGAEYRGTDAGTPVVRVGRPHLVAEETIVAATQATRPLVGEHGVVIRVGDHDHDHGLVVLGGGAGAFTGAQLQLCQAVARQLSQALELARTHAEVVGSREQVVERLALAVSLRDGGTSAHSRRMSLTCELLAAALGVDPERCRLLRVASAMHDIGKVAISDAVLLKPGPLTTQERAHIEGHAEIGHTILAGSGSALLELAAAIALNHHERWDGTGYPHGRRGSEIPLEGRIAAVADVFDALVSDRPYRSAMTTAEALAVIHAGSGTHFDPAVVAALDATIADVLELGK